MDTRIDLVRRFRQFVVSVQPNESIAGLLRKQMEYRTKPEPLPEKYFFVKQLCNPQEAYWSYIAPETKKSLAFARKLNFGSKLHRLSSFWFELLPEFRVEEGKIDGIFVGISGVRGKVDYCVGDSIFELKTKSKIPENIEEIYNDYIQDLEQLCFYAIIHPQSPKINYLVFMEESEPHNLKIFRVVINDFGKIKSLLINRIEKLREAIKKKDSSRLGRCRYYDRICEFQKQGICSCVNLEPLPTDTIKKSVEISYDEELTNKLEEIKKNKKLPEDLFIIFNLIGSRRYLAEKTGKIEKREIEETAEVDKDRYEAILDSIISELKFKANISRKQEIKNLFIEPRLYIPYKWFNNVNSAKPEGELTPYLIKVSKAKNIKRPSDYALAELGMICSVYNKSKGVIIVIYPDFKDFIQVYEITYNKIPEIAKEVKEVINELEKEKDIFSLPPCPEFMNNDKTCPLMKECHSERRVGCCPGYVLR